MLYSKADAWMFQWYRDVNFQSKWNLLYTDPGRLFQLGKWKCMFVQNLDVNGLCSLSWSFPNLNKPIPLQ